MMKNKIWKLGSIAVIVAVGATMYYLGASSSGARATGNAPASHVAKPTTSPKSKITTQPTTSTNAPSCTAAQLMIMTPTMSLYYDPRLNTSIMAIGMSGEAPK